MVRDWGSKNVKEELGVDDEEGGDTGIEGLRWIMKKKEIGH